MDSPANSTAIDLRSLSSRESAQVEWKENVGDEDDVVATLVAFANDISNLGGGYVVCGAAEKRDSHGFQTLEVAGLPAARLAEVRGKVLSLCRDRVDPPLVPLIEELPCSDPARRVLVFVMPAGRRAHSFRSRNDVNRFHVRSGDRTIEARNGLLLELLGMKGDVEPWDRRPTPGAAIADLDLLAIRDALQRCGIWREELGIDHYLDPSTRIHALVPSLAVRENPTNAIRPRNFATLLFAREPQRFFLQAHSILSIYPGPDRAEPYSERLELDGTILQQLRRMLERLKSEAYTLMDKSSGRPPNVAKYPERALEEAVVNAFAHRDYENQQPARVTVFSDRIEILSPGGLPRTTSLDELRSGAVAPNWRNQALGWFLIRLRYAQGEGQGIATILQTMEREGCPPPRFDATAESVSCILPAHPRHSRMRDLQAVDSLVEAGRLEEAGERVLALLNEDPVSHRGIAGLCRIQRSLGDATPVFRFVRENFDALARLGPTTKGLLVGTLTQIPSKDATSAEARALARMLEQESPRRNDPPT